MNKKYTYEDKSEIIDEEIRKRYHSWKLNFLCWFDFEDAAQIIRSHIYVKWNKWDQSRPFENWVNVLITNQFINITKKYGKGILPPCINCQYNNGRDKDKYLCKKTSSGYQSSECNMYDDWLKFRSEGKGKPVSLDLISETTLTSIEQEFPLDEALQRIHLCMKERLNDKHYFIYKMLFIDCIGEEQVAKILKFKSSEKNKKAGYRQIINLKNKYKYIVKEILKQNWLYKNERGK